MDSHPFHSPLAMLPAFRNRVVMTRDNNLDMRSIMSKKILEAAQSAWVRPQLVKLGKLEDVAPGAPGAAEGSSGKS